MQFGAGGVGAAVSRYRLELGGELATIVPARVASAMSKVLRDALLKARSGGERLDPEAAAVIGELLEQGVAWRRREMSAPMSDGGPANGHGRMVGEIEGSFSSLISSTGVAAALGLSDRHVRRLAATGKFPAQRDGGGRWRFEAAVIEALRGEPR